MLNLYQSNKLDSIFKLFLAVRSPTPKILEPEMIVVPSQGIQRWLQLNMAKEKGVAANIKFQLPSSFSWSLMQKAFKDLPNLSAFDRDVMAWRVLDLLPQLVTLKGTSLEATWSEADKAGRYELAWRVADVFDQYLIYRADWKKAWEQGKCLNLGDDERWQQELWQKLSRVEQPHRAQLSERIITAILADDIALPTQIHVFGISSLPPSVWQLLNALGQKTEVNLFVINPSEQYWGHIKKGESTEHQLLASLGQQGRDFLNAVATSGVNEPVENCAFVDPVKAGSNQLLAVLQSDLLHLKIRDEAEKVSIDEGDDSLQIHVCHSPLREVEVLHDQLLMQFKKDETLTPDQVLVISSDIQRYAPLIEAVFATREKPAKIPYSIADKKLESEEPLLQQFKALIALPGSDFEVGDILTLLDEPSIREKFELEAGDVLIIQRWCEELHIHWGRDANDRKSKGLLADVPFTWREALSRLQLGFAMPYQWVEAGGLFNQKAPANAVFSMSQAQVMAKFSCFLEALINWEKQIQEDRSLLDWAAVLFQFIQVFFKESDDNKRLLQYIRDAISSLDEQAAQVAHLENQPFSVIKRWLSQHISGLESQRGFLQGGVTFCAKAPRRSVPFKIIAFIGLDDGVFPSQQKPWSFDLMMLNPKEGDRSRRQDDRYLFLETLLAADKKLILSYVGLDDVNGTIRPPSPVLAELIDQIKKTVAFNDQKSFENRFYTKHALQPFSPRYFYQQDSKLFSFSESLRQLSQGIVDDKHQDNRIGAAFSKELGEMGEDLKKISIEQFEQFLAHPQRYFLRKRLGVNLPYADSEFLAHEPVDFPDFRALRQRLLIQPDVGIELLRAEGLIPSGSWGESLYKKEKDLIDGLAQKRKENKPVAPFRVHIKIGDITIFGSITELTESGLMRYSLENKIYATDVLKLAFINAVLSYEKDYKKSDLEKSKVSTVFGVGNKSIELKCVLKEKAEKRLLKFIEAYQYGMSQPLPFFRRSSLSYAKKHNFSSTEGKLFLSDNETASIDIKKSWEGSDYAKGDIMDAWIRLIWRDECPIGLDDDFEYFSSLLYEDIQGELITEFGDKFKDL